MISFLLMICILALTIITVLSKTILDRQYIMNYLDEQQYYSELKPIIEEKFDEYLLQSGLEEEVIRNIITEEKIKEDIELIIYSMYEGKEYEIDTSILKEQLDKNINMYLENNNIVLNGEESIREFIDLIDKNYRTQILDLPILQSSNTIYSTIMTFINYITIAISVFIGVLILILILSTKPTLMFLNYIGIGLLATGILLFFPKIIYTKMYIDEWYLINTATSELITGLISNVMNQYMTIGIIMVIISIFIIILGNKPQKN